MQQAARPTQDSAPESASFIVDCDLGVLARYLRLMGFDTVLGDDGASRSDDDSVAAAEIALAARREDRTLLTRDPKLLSRGRSIPCYLLRETDPRLQLHEVLRLPGVADVARPFTRCVTCNIELAASDDESLRRCSECGRAYWPNTDDEHLGRLALEALDQGREERQ